MSILDRIKLASQILFERKASITEITPTGGLNPYYPQVTFDSAVRNALTKNELIFACTMLKVDSLSQARLAVYDKGKDTEIDSHPLIDLLETPNPDMDGDDFKGLISLHCDLAGVSYWEKVRARSGKVAELWPLRPDWVKPLTNAKTGALVGYNYEIPGRAGIKFRKEDILPFRNLHPTDLYAGLPPIQAAARGINVDNATSDFLTALMQNGGVPIGFLKTTIAALTGEQRQKIRAQWQEAYGGSTKWSTVGVLDTNLDFVKTGFNLEELGFEFVDARTESRICMVFRTPPSMIHASVSNGSKPTLSEADTDPQETKYWRATLLPQFDRMRSRLNRYLVSDFGDNIEVRWDLSEIAALQEDRSKAFTRAIQGWQAGAYTMNQFLSEIGETEINNGDYFLRTPGMIVVPAKEQDVVAEPEPIEPITAPDDSNEDTEDTPANEDGKRRKSKAAPIASDAPDAKRRAQFEKKMKSTLTKYFNGELADIRKEVSEMAST